MKKLLHWSSITLGVVLSVSIATQISLADDGLQSVRAATRAKKTKSTKKLKNSGARKPQSVESADSEAVPSWTPTRTFDPINQCPKLFFDEIFKDRVTAGIPYLNKSPKEECPMNMSNTLPDAESLEAVLSLNTVTALGLPPNSITNSSCLYKDYRGTDLDTVFGRFYPKETATEVERMTGVAEYYYHMNKIKYAEQGILSQMAGIDAILGGAILPDKNCADPYNPFSEKWCEAYRAPTCQGGGRLNEVAAALKTKIDKVAQIRKQISEIPEPDQPESKEQIKELEKQTLQEVGSDIILNSPKFKDELQRSRGDVAAALRAQLLEYRADFARKLVQFQEASACINSSKSVSCPQLENVVNKVPDDFLPEMVGNGGDPEKTSLAQAYMDRISCLQVARGKKDSSGRLQLNASVAVGSYAIGAGEANAVMKAIAWAWSVSSAIPEVKDAFHSCIEASHTITGNTVSQLNPYAPPSCSQTGEPAELMALHNYTACGLGIGDALLVALTPLEAKGANSAFKALGRNEALVNGARKVGVQSFGLMKQVMLYSVGSNLLSAFINVDMNVVNQESGKVGSETLGPTAKILSAWISSEDSPEKLAGKHAMNQLNNGLDPSKFAGLSPEEANKLFQDTAASAYKILLNNQEVLRGDQLSGLSLKWNQRIQPPVFYAQMDAAYARYYGAKNDMANLDKAAPPLSDEQKKEAIAHDQASMQEAELHIARNIAAKILYDFMTPQYRTGNSLNDPQMENGLSLIYDAQQTGMLTDVVRKDIQELLSMDGWSAAQVNRVIEAQINGQTENNSP